MNSIFFDSDTNRDVLKTIRHCKAIEKLFLRSKIEDEKHQILVVGSIIIN